MTDDKVITLRGGEVENERRAGFMRSVAASFDLYVETYGHEPDAIVYVLCGLTQTSQIAWDIRGVSEPGTGSILSLAAVHMLTEAGNGRQGR